MKKLLCLILALLLAAATLLSCTPQTDDPTPPDDEPEQPPVTDPTDPEQGGDDPMQEEITYDGRYNPHASRAEGQSDITLREYSIVDGTLIQPDADDSDLPKELEEVINTYMTKYDPVGIKGYVTNFQHSGGYSDAVRINTEAVMAYVSVPSQLEKTISSWEHTTDYYSLNIMMPINRDSHDYVTHDEENFGHIQTDKNGKYITHSTSDKVYYMVPTEGWVEYIWAMVEEILDNYKIDSLTFEEPEMWYASGYSDGFKEEWELYYDEPWQDQNASPEAMLKTMRLKVYLFDRALSTIAQRMHEKSPDTKLYVASHSTASYTSIQITAGLNSYLATGEIDGVIGQTWTNTAAVPILAEGKSREVPYENAYLGYASYAGASGSLDLFAITDAMADGDWTQDRAYPIYHDTVIAALMQDEIHRFEASVWPSRGFAAVTSEYRTEQLNIFEGLNEMSGKAITTSAGTPGITYLLSDSLSWQFGPSSWGLSSKDGYYGVTYPVISDGVPLKVRSMEQIRTADDLDDVTLLLLSWDCQKPLSEDVCDAIADWIMAGGTALYIGGYDKFADSEAEWWAAWGSPLQALLDKLGLDITASKSKPGTTAAWRWKDGSNPPPAALNVRLTSQHKDFMIGFTGAEVHPLISTNNGEVYGIEQSAGKGTLLAIGFPSAAFSQTGGTASIRSLVEYACEFTDYEYAPTTLMWTQRGRIVAAHSFKDENVLVGAFIDLFDPTLPVISYKQIDKGGNALLCDVSDTDLSVPRYVYGGGSLMAPVKESAKSTVFAISAPAGTTVSTRLMCADGTYPESVSAVDADGNALMVTSVWDNETDSLLVQLIPSVGGATVTINWGDKAVEDTRESVFEELTFITNSKNQDAAFLIKNTAGANDSFRFADATGELIYKIDLTTFRDATVTMNIKQNYLVQYSPDGMSWKTIADYSEVEGYAGTLHGGGNDTLVSVSSVAVPGSDALYLRIADCDPSDGWGGTISTLSIRYRLFEGEEPYKVEDFAKVEDKPGNKVDTSGFEPINQDFEAKYKGRQKLTINVNSTSREDAEFIVKDTAASNASYKYTDLDKELIYKFDLSDYSDAVVVATVCQNYLVQVSADGKKWTTVQDFAAVNGGRKDGSGNTATVGVAAAKYAKDADYLYLRFANADTQTGWGTAVSKIEVYYE